MIPIFPDFKKIEINDKKIIDKFTSHFPPYNDFEFVSLWTYNIGNKNSFSILNDNLVIKIHDFITGEYFYSTIGNTKIQQTIKLLLQKSEEDGLKPQLHLIPETVVKELKGSENEFIIKEDLDSFDYILSINELADLEGSRHANKRHHISKFKRTYQAHTLQTMDLHNKNIQQEIKDLFILWEKQKGKERKETIIELTAIERLFDLISKMSIHCLGVYSQEKLVGFSTFHLVQDNYALLSFIKGDTTHRWIYEYLNHEIAKYLKTLGCVYLNYEQDLGIPTLRESKRRYHPIFYLKKYIIEEKIKC